MSQSAHGALAAAPLEFSIASIEHKLLELRAEIDAILAQLAASKAAQPAAAETRAPIAVPQEDDPEPALAAPEASAEAVLDGPANASPEAGQEAEPTVCETADPDRQPVAEAADGGEDLRIDPIEEPLADLQLTWVPQADAAPEIVIESQPAAADAAPEIVMEAQQAAADLDAACAEEPAAPAPVDAQVPAAEADEPAPACAGADVVPLTVPAAAASEAQVIALEPRQHRLNDDMTLPARSGRRAATRVAACILALLVAGTALVAADRDAIGSVQVPTWMRDLPSAAAWTMFGQKQGLAGEESEHDARRSAEDALQQRYRDLWPSGA